MFAAIDENSHHEISRENFIRFCRNLQQVTVTASKKPKKVVSPPTRLADSRVSNHTARTKSAAKMETNRKSLGSQNLSVAPNRQNKTTVESNQAVRSVDDMISSSGSIHNVLSSTGNGSIRMNMKPANNNIAHEDRDSVAYLENRINRIKVGLGDLIRELEEQSHDEEEDDDRGYDDNIFSWTRN